MGRGDWVRGSKHQLTLIATDKAGKKIARLSVDIRTAGDGTTAASNYEAALSAMPVSRSGGILRMPRFVKLDAQGIQYSSNPIWNSCIRQTVVYDQHGRPFTCQRYRVGHKWVYPDLQAVEFTWNPKSKYIKIPDGITAVRGGEPTLIPTLTGSQLSAMIASGAKLSVTSAVVP